MSACSSWCGYCGGCTDGPRPNATCPDCGDDFWKGPGDVGSLCDACCEARDAHTSLLELRMAKASLPAVDDEEVA